MRFVSFLAATLFTVSASATDIFPGFKDIREVKTTTPGYFEFIVGEKGQVDGQAAEYTDPQLEGLYQRLLNENKEFRKIVEDIYDENGCTMDGKYKDKQLGDSFCGSLQELNKQNTVLWSFGRVGWMSAYQSRRTFLAWTSAGSGRYTDVAVQLTTVVSVEAIETPKQDALTYKVTVDMTNFGRLKQEHR